LPCEFEGKLNTRPCLNTCRKCPPDPPEIAFESTVDQRNTSASPVASFSFAMFNVPPSFRHTTTITAVG